MKDVFQYVEANRGRFIAELLTLLRQPSISAQNVGVTECAELVLRFMSEAGVDARLIPTAGYPVVFGQVLAPGAARTVLIYGHYDVQPPEPLEEWKTPPFEPSLRNGRIYARGAGDNKGQMFAHLKAVEAVLQTRGRLPVNVKLCFEGEEEISSRNLPGFVGANRELLAADMVYASDGPMHASGPIVFFGCRGLLYLELTARGAKRDLHSGNYGGVAPAPAAHLARALASLWTDRGKVAVGGFYDRVRKPSRADRRALQAIPFAAKSVREDLGCPPATAADAGGYYRRLLIQPNLNIAGLTAGYQGPGSKTIIPHMARAKLDARLVMDQDPDEIEDKIRLHLKRRGFGDIEVKRLGAVPPSRTPMDHPLGRAVVRAVKQAWGRRPILFPNLGGTIPDYLFTQVLGLPSVWVPYAPHDEANHAPNESITIEGFMNGIRSTAAGFFEIAAV
ncbi:MAG: M20/M25/M40 family metallo-hydrolase [Candidatus Rokubacteria bacterium]|nr:M20/M25/M40 family metallo-hydrolase [Candidatus Rokubacteria bacterium]